MQNDPVNFVDPTGLMPQICGLFNMGDGRSGFVCFGDPAPFNGWEPKPGGPPDNPSPPEPQDPTPQPQQTQPLPFNSCEEFVRWLGNLTTGALLIGHLKNYGQRVTARVFGSDLAEIAYLQYDRHINNGFAGFRPELVSAGEGTPQGPQGAGVYGHILLNAGLRLIEQSGDPGGP